MSASRDADQSPGEAALLARIRELEAALAESRASTRWLESRLADTSFELGLARQRLAESQEMRRILAEELEALRGAKD